jgi:uncharacterized membrane protein
MWMTPRNVVLAISGVSALAMLYVGAYQIRAVEHLKCPLLKHGCEAVADASFARPFGIPDGFIAAAMYGLLILLALIGRETSWVRFSVRALAVLALLANVIGVADMTRLGAYCFFCLLTTAMSPFLAWAAFIL